MPTTYSQEANAALPASLRIRFSAGERPHLFWVSHWSEEPEGRCRYKILSKSLPDRSLEVLVLEEGSRVRHRAVAQIQLPADSPSGRLERWVETLAEDIGARFELFDLRHVQSAKEWCAVARRLGWMPDSERGPAER